MIHRQHREHLIASPPSKISSESILSLLEYEPTIVKELDLDSDLAKKIVSSANSERGAISRPAKEARELMLHSKIWAGEESIRDILS